MARLGDRVTMDVIDAADASVADRHGDSGNRLSRGLHAAGRDRFGSEAIAMKRTSALTEMLATRRRGVVLRSSIAGFGGSGIEDCGRSPFSKLDVRGGAV